jgi:hypothetical protein
MSEFDVLLTKNFLQLGFMVAFGALLAPLLKMLQRRRHSLACRKLDLGRTARSFRANLSATAEYDCRYVHSEGSLA